MALLLDLARKVSPAVGIPSEVEALVELAETAIRDGICLVGDFACAAGVVKPYITNKSVMVGHIVFWNFTRPSGVGILTAIAEEFRQRGASHITASSHHPKHAAGGLYRRLLGARPAEMDWIAPLK